MCLKLLPHLNSRSLLSSRTRHRSEGFVTALTCGVWWWWQFQKNCESPNRLLSNLHMGRTLYTSSLHIAIPEIVQCQECTRFLWIICLVLASECERVYTSALCVWDPSANHVSCQHSRRPLELQNKSGYSYVPFVHAKCHITRTMCTYRKWIKCTQFESLSWIWTCFRSTLCPRGRWVVCGKRHVLIRRKHRSSSWGHVHVDEKWMKGTLFNRSTNTVQCTRLCVHVPYDSWDCRLRVYCHNPES